MFGSRRKPYFSFRMFSFIFRWELAFFCGYFDSEMFSRGFLK